MREQIIWYILKNNLFDCETSSQVWYVFGGTWPYWKFWWKLMTRLWCEHKLPPRWRKTLFSKLFFFKWHGIVYQKSSKLTIGVIFLLSYQEIGHTYVCISLYVHNNKCCDYIYEPVILLHSEQVSVPSGNRARFIPFERPFQLLSSKPQLWVKNVLEDGRKAV